MKKYLFMSVVLIMGTSVFSSCSKDEEVSPTVDNEPVLIVDFEGDSFTKLIDNPQYSGPQIYSATEYKWTDTKTTLSGVVEKDDWTAFGAGYGWKCGLAISNYVDNGTAVTYDKQLAVPVSNGSKNFAVCYGDGSTIYFADGVARGIVSFDVCLTTYAYNNVKKNLGPSYLFKAIAEFTLADGTKTTQDIIFAEGSSMKEGWNNVKFGNIVASKVVFKFDGSDKSEWGLNTPAYFAIDNIVVYK